jgi:hypothetical protein
MWVGDGGGLSVKENLLHIANSLGLLGTSYLVHCNDPGWHRNFSRVSRGTVELPNCTELRKILHSRGFIHHIKFDFIH